MFYAWSLFAGYYAATAALTGWGLWALLGPQNVIKAVSVFLGLQLLRAVPGSPAKAVHFINYHVLLTGYRLNYL